MEDIPRTAFFPAQTQPSARRGKTEVKGWSCMGEGRGGGSVQSRVHVHTRKSRLRGTHATALLVRPRRLGAVVWVCGCSEFPSRLRGCVGVEGVWVLKGVCVRRDAWDAHTCGTHTVHRTHATHRLLGSYRIRLILFFKLYRL